MIKQRNSNYFLNLINKNEWEKYWANENKDITEIYELGNLTLLDKTINTNLGKKGKTWDKKILILWGTNDSKIARQSLLNYENEEQGFKNYKLLITYDDIKKRSEYIINWVKDQKLFEYIN